MDLIDKSNYYRACEILENPTRADFEDLRLLCLALARGCTPYLGYHAKIEAAFRRFVENVDRKAA